LRPFYRWSSTGTVKSDPLGLVFMDRDKNYRYRVYQFCGSGSGLDQDSMGSLDPDPDPGGQKITNKNRKKVSNILQVLDVLF
jgi:hypothetical protein